MRPDKACGAYPHAIPIVGTIFDLAPQDWKYNSDGTRLYIRVAKVLIKLSRWYSGTWVWVEGPVQVPQGGIELQQVLIRVSAIPPECRDRNYRPDDWEAMR